MSIVIIGAMLEEISPLKHALTHPQQQHIASVDFYTGNLNNIPIVLVKSGIGKVNAAIASTLAIQLFKPRCMINIGAVGALHGYLTAGSTLLFDCVAYHDVDAVSFGYAPNQMPGMPANFSSATNLIQLFERNAIKLGISFHTGMGVTGDQFIADNEVLAAVKHRFPHALGIDMESTAIAQVAYVFDVPFIPVRGISDHANDASPNAFKKNLDKASNQIAQLLMAAIEELGNIAEQ